MEETNVTAINQKLFFSDVLCLEVPLYHPPAPQECEARMLVCSVGLTPARRRDHNHLQCSHPAAYHTLPKCLTANLVNNNTVGTLSKAKKSLPD